MMTNDPFARFEIEHLSSQSINLFLTNLPLFIIRYLYKYKNPTNAAMIRGSLTDKFIGSALRYQWDVDLKSWERTAPNYSVKDLQERANKYFDTEIDDENFEDTPEKIQTEKDNLNKYIELGVPFYRSLGDPVSYQKKVSLDFDELSIPIIGYLDLEFEDQVRDIKTTARRPAKLPEPVSRQLAIYAAATEKTKAVADYLLVSKTKAEVITLECDDLNLRLDEVYRVSLAMMNLLHNNDINSLCSQCFPDFSDWRWDQPSIQVAKELWRIK